MQRSGGCCLQLQQAPGSRQRLSGSWRPRLRGSAGGALCAAKRRQAAVQVSASLQIDRNFHMERQWQRQLKREEMLASIRPESLGSKIIAVQDGQHLEALLEAAGGSLVAVLLYTKSCGLCKAVENELQELLTESRRCRARLVALKHDIRDEFDFPTDISRAYQIRAVPRVLFFIDGAVVATGGGSVDSRLLTSRAQVESSLQAQRTRLRQTVSQLLLRHTPSARK